MTARERPGQKAKTAAEHADAGPAPIQPFFDGAPVSTSEADRHPVELWFAVSLATLAGWVDAVAFVRWSGVYVSFMSGNSTTFSASLSTGDWAMALPVGAVLAGFIVGVICGEWVAWAGDRYGRWGHALVLFSESVLLFAAAIADAVPGTGWLPPVLLAVGLGVQNATIYQVGGVSIAVSYVTGTLVNIGRGIADAAFGLGSWRAPLPYVALWSGLIGGAAVGALVTRQNSPLAIAIAASTALIFSIGTAFVTYRTNASAS